MMCRRSSRKCMVMLSAPACSASNAGMHRVGMARAARIAHRRHMVHVHPEGDLASVQPSVSCSIRATRAAQFPQRHRHRHASAADAPPGSAPRRHAAPAAARSSCSAIIEVRFVQAGHAVAQHVQQALLEQAQRALQVRGAAAGRPAQRRNARTVPAADHAARSAAAPVPTGTRRASPAHAAMPCSPPAAGSSSAPVSRGASPRPGPGTPAMAAKGCSTAASRALLPRTPCANTDRRPCSRANSSITRPESPQGALVQHKGWRVFHPLQPLFHAQLAQRLRAVGPVLAHLYPQGQVQAATQQFRSIRGGRRHRRASGVRRCAPITMGFWPARSTQITAETTSWPSSSSPVPSTSTAMPLGQLFVQLQRELLADHLGDAEVVAAVGELLDGEQRRGDRQVLRDDVRPGRCMSAGVLARTRGTMSTNCVVRGQLREVRQQLVARASRCPPCSPPRRWGDWPRARVAAPARPRR